MKFKNVIVSDGGNGGGDSIAPVITLNGENTMTLTRGTNFVDLGATAIDNIDGIVNVTVTGTINTAVLGTYTLTYTAIDSSGNTSTLTRNINIESMFPWNHGNLEVAGDNRMLQHTDGTGFFWMADTAWELYRKTRDDIDLYIENRTQNKFTVIQTLAIHYGRSVSNGVSAFINYDITQPNEEYWQHIDYMISKAEERGLYVALLPTWHDAITYGTFSTPDDATLYGEWIANRYRNRPNIIWVLGVIRQ